VRHCIHDGKKDELAEAVFGIYFFLNFSHNTKLNRFLKFTSIALG
jgi:hypothetical protein